MAFEFTSNNALLADGLINISDLKTIMVEIGEEINDQELNEMIKATGTLDGKGMFSQIFRVIQ